MKLKRIMAGILAASTAVSLAACSGGTTTSSAGTSSDATSSTDSKDSETSNVTSDESSTEESSEVIDIPTGLSLTVLTNRTDRHNDGTFDAMVEGFEEKYGCTVTFQSYTDYDLDVAMMMNTDDYGDVLNIPTSVKVGDLSNYFEPLGSYDDLKEKYNWADTKMYDGTVYGLATMGSVTGGIVYNKKVWADAGITEIPKTPEDFIECLKKIRDNTDAIPYYTNFAAADWTLKEWAQMAVSVSGDPAYETNKLIEKKDLFFEGDALYELMELMFNVFSDATLHEADPITSDWEGCKIEISKGNIGTMTLGSWAVAQFKQVAAEQGEDPENIGYMPLPFNIGGKQYAQSSSDTCMAINKNSDEDVKKLAKAYIEWFISESGYSQSEGGVNTLKGGQMPSYLEDFADVELFMAEPAPTELSGVYNTIDNESEVGLTKGDSANFKLKIAEAAFAGESIESMKTILNDANSRWNTARDANQKLNDYLAANS